MALGIFRILLPSLTPLKHTKLGALWHSLLLHHQTLNHIRRLPRRDESKMNDTWKSLRWDLGTVKGNPGVLDLREQRGSPDNSYRPKAKLNGESSPTGPPLSPSEVIYTRTPEPKLPSSPVGVPLVPGFRTPAERDVF